METLNLILSKLGEYFPQLMGYALVIIVVGFIVWKVSSFYFRTNNIHREFPEVKKLLTDISSGFKTLNSVLLEKSIISHSCFSESNSPRVINDLGKKVLTESGADVVFENMKNELLIELEKSTFQSSLELEKESLNLLLSKMNEPKFSGIQNFVYQHPNFEDKPLSYSDILFIMSLKLRDMYIDKHPEITQ